MDLEPELMAEAARWSPFGLAVVDASGHVLWANAAFADLTGKRTAQGTVRFDLATSPGLAPILDAVNEAVSRGSVAERNEVDWMADSEGADRAVDIRARPLTDRGTSTPNVLVSLEDVSERTRERARGHLFYSSFLTSTNAIEVTDDRGILVDVNPAFERTYGYARAECIGRKPNLVRSRHTSAEVYRQMWADLLDPARGHWSGEILNRDRVGKERPVFLTITAIRNAQGAITHYLGVAVDLTELKAWERGAAHAERLASLGQLAAGVAHEINTPLANILLVAESIRRRAADAWVRTRAEAISGQVKVADRIVLGLLDFSRRGETNFATLDLRSIVQESVAFVRGKWTADVEVEEAGPPAPVAVYGDRRQLVQVFTNLLNNAYDAVEGSGRIRVLTSAAGERATVEVTDSGSGIPAEVLPHLFEPFFTTKGEGKGTGLGLAICHGIVQTHHGAIVATNAPEGGARFTVELPWAADRPIDPS
ncbi:MAG TPA: ATP-binding protein [Thermoplasmata archaeon]|nr:ATP-binding protein [Thermoplasmata archaeon]